MLPGDDQPKLFERIDASKLQGALSNASVMGQLEVRLNMNCNSVCGCTAAYLRHIGPASLTGFGNQVLQLFDVVTKSAHPNMPSLW